MVEIIYFIIIGAFAGLLGGLFGVGGGFLLVPAQIIVYNFFEIHKEHQIKMAIATSLAVVVFNTMVAGYIHHKNQTIDYSLIRRIVIGIVLGALFGAFLTAYFSPTLLQLIFGLFECLFGFYFIASSLISTSSVKIKINAFLFNLIAMGVSALSILLGIGGGIFMVPLLTLLSYPLKQTIGSSSLITFIVSFIGAATMLLPPIGHLNYLYLPAFIPFTLGAVIGAPFGANLTHTLPTTVLKKLFGVLLLILGVIVLFKK